DDEHDRMRQEQERLAQERDRLAATPAIGSTMDREVALDSTTDSESDDDDEDHAPPMARAVPELEALPSLAPLAPLQPIAPLPPVPSLTSLAPPRTPPADIAAVENESDDDHLADHPERDDVDASARIAAPEDTDRNELP